MGKRKHSQSVQPTVVVTCTPLSLSLSLSLWWQWRTMCACACSCACADLTVSHSSAVQSVTSLQPAPNGQGQVRVQVNAHFFWCEEAGQAPGADSHAVGACPGVACFRALVRQGQPWDLTIKRRGRYSLQQTLCSVKSLERKRSSLSMGL